MQHCKVFDALSLSIHSNSTITQTITIGDCTKSETKSYFRDHILPRVPERLRPTLRFEVLYDAFGGKLAHWHDFVTDYGMEQPHESKAQTYLICYSQLWWKTR